MYEVARRWFVTSYCWFKIDRSMGLCLALSVRTGPGAKQASGPSNNFSLVGYEYMGGLSEYI